MKKTAGFTLIIAMMFILSACGNQQALIKDQATKAIDKAASEIPAVKNPLKSSREDCMSGCKTLWKSNESNKGKTDGEMEMNCSSLCDAGQGIQKQDVASCEKAEKGILQDACYGDIAKNTGDSKLCEKISSKMLISTCYIAIVEKTKDKSLCEKITVKMMKDLCLSK